MTTAEGTRSPRKPEPGSMTLVDLCSLVAGVALGFAAVVGLPDLPSIPPVLLHVAFGMSRFFLWMTMAFSVVALGRVATFRRMPRAAEWVAIVVTASTLAGLPWFNVDGWVNSVLALRLPWVERLDFDGWRWAVAGLAGAAMASTLAVLWVGRRRFPSWLKTLLLGWGAVLALAGPLGVFALLGGDLVSPREGFGPGNLAIFRRQACVLFGAFPTGVLFGLPAMAAALGRVAGRRWAWHEWAGVACSLLAGSLLALLYRGEFNDFSPAWLAERALILGWSLLVAVTCRWILIHAGPAWDRWLGGPGDQDRPASPGSVANARIC